MSSESRSPDTRSPDTKSDVTRLLKSWQGGKAEALEDLLPLVYDELKDLAASYLRRERSEHTLQATALVHEAYVRMTSGEPLDLNDRSHFFVVAAQAMRRILVDHARRQRADKRIGAHQKIAIEDAPQLVEQADADVLAVHEALELLSQIHPRQGQLVELRYFGGLSLEEVSQVLDVSESTLARDWRVARRWMHRRLTA
ncbi:MAG: sigma-70 family RNA polymerase sigma factor [Acidobacteriota bacterium]